jgi:hypothetical protein
MRGLLGMLPWAVVLVIAGAAIALLLQRHEALGSWVLAVVILAHGLVHVLYLVSPPEPPADGRGPRWPFDLGRSWLVALAGARRGRRIAIGLVVIAVATSALAAAATVGLLPAAAWPALVVAAAVASLVLLLLAFDVQLVLGVGVDVALLLVVVTGAWRP